MTVVGLTSLENLRLHVLRDSSDYSADEKLSLYGEMMSERVTDYCRREFLPDPLTDDDDPVARVVAYDGSGAIDFAPSELRSLESISLYTDRDESLQQTLDASQYALAPRGKTRQSTYLGVDLLLPMLSQAHYGFGWEVTITGRWGMASVPKAVELAVLVSVDAIMLNPASMALQQLGGYSVQPDQIDPSFDNDARGGLPREALWALAPYRRRRRTGSLIVRRPTPLNREWPRV